MEKTVEERCALDFEKMVTNTQTLVNQGKRFENGHDTQIAIREFIKDALSEVEENVPQLKVSEIILVGSYQEGTKIFKADEFDFLVVIEELSDPGLFTIETDEATAQNPGTVKLKLVNTEVPDGKWKMYSRNGYLRCFEPIVESLRGDSFGYRVIEAISKLYKNTDIRCCRTNNGISFAGNGTKMINSRARPMKQVALFKSAEVKFPNVLLDFTFDGHDVSADLCPAIRYKHTEHCFNQGNCSFKGLAAQVMNRGSILLVGQRDFLFRVTYTETEVDYMKNKMKDGHKSLYIFLKVIAAYFRECWKPVPSYVLKTICIKHDQVCERKANGNTMLRCFDELIKVLIKSMEVDSLTSAFDRRLNLLKKDSAITPHYRSLVVAPVLPEISKVCRNVSGKETSQVLREIKTTIDRADSQFDPSKPFPTK